MQSGRGINAWEMACKATACRLYRQTLYTHLNNSFSSKIISPDIQLYLFMQKTG